MRDGPLLDATTEALTPISAVFAWTKERRERLLGRVVGFLTGLPVYFLGLSVSLSEVVPLREQFGKGYDPYYLLFQMLLGRTASALRTIPEQAVTIDIVVAEHPEYSGLLRVGYENAKNNLRGGDRLGTLTIASPSEVEALQAADLVAYETLKYQRNQRVDGQKRRTRWPMQEIGKTQRYLIAHANVNEVVTGTEKATN